MCDVSYCPLSKHNHSREQGSALLLPHKLEGPRPDSIVHISTTFVFQQKNESIETISCKDEMFVEDLEEDRRTPQRIVGRNPIIWLSKFEDELV
jgi:hypothetical protein